MTLRLWFGGGVNIFASYSNVTGAKVLIDANKVYWSKTCFLFLSILLYALNFDYRFAVGLAATFWAVSLILMFGPTPVLFGVMLVGVILVVQQKFRNQIFSK